VGGEAIFTPVFGFLNGPTLLRQSQLEPVIMSKSKEREHKVLSLFEF